MRRTCEPFASGSLAGDAMTQTGLPSNDTGGEHAIPCLIAAGEIARRVRELARQISADYAGRQPLVVGVLKGAWVFMADLVRELTIPVCCDFVMPSSYGSGTETTGCVQLHLDLTTPAQSEHLLLVEDVVDTGLCISWL